ncbi:hypothetical protein C882_1643 [Caenispirillum salinarum AK4]|uniref:Glycosyltransferase n=2 Tax=Caenispirillum TaxID=414051 RepID=K9H3F7_9PROT|nr:hypothetical protein C882_1643 [Caenispirillum salinarum AK4]
MRRHHAVVDDFSIGAPPDRAPDIVHVHWPEAFMWDGRTPVQRMKGARWTLQALRTLHRRGSRVVWTCHNEKPHDLHGADMLTWTVFERMFQAQLSGAIFMTEASRQHMLHRSPLLRRLPTTVIPHGHYQDWYGSPVGQVTARQRLGLPADRYIYLFFGRIRPYKNIDALTTLIGPTVAADESAHIVIAGKPATPALETSLAALAEMPNITLRLGFVPDEEVRDLMCASDAVVLPYPVFNSGVALLAASYGRPFVTPDTAPVRETAGLLGAGNAHLFDGPLTPHTLAEARARFQGRDSGPDLTAFSWDRIGRATMDFMEAAMGRRTTTPEHTSKQD